MHDVYDTLIIAGGGGGGGNISDVMLWHIEI